MELRAGRGARAGRRAARPHARRGAAARARQQAQGSVASRVLRGLGRVGEF